MTFKYFLKIILPDYSLVSFFKRSEQFFLPISKIICIDSLIGSLDIKQNFTDFSLFHWANKISLLFPDLRPISQFFPTGEENPIFKGFYNFQDN